MHRSSRRPNVRSRRCWSECGEHNQRVPEPIYIRLRIWGSEVRILPGAPARKLKPLVFLLRRKIAPD
jgi:hypothetical protein